MSNITESMRSQPQTTTTARSNIQHDEPPDTSLYQVDAGGDFDGGFNYDYDFEPSDNLQRSPAADPEPLMHLATLAVADESIIEHLMREMVEVDLTGILRWSFRDPKVHNSFIASALIHHILVTFNKRTLPDAPECPLWRSMYCLSNCLQAKPRSDEELAAILAFVRKCLPAAPPTIMYLLQSLDASENTPVSCKVLECDVALCCAMKSSDVAGITQMVTALPSTCSAGIGTLTDAVQHAILALIQQGSTCPESCNHYLQSGTIGNMPTVIAVQLPLKLLMGTTLGSCDLSVDCLITGRAAHPWMRFFYHVVAILCETPHGVIGGVCLQSGKKPSPPSLFGGMSSARSASCRVKVCTSTKGYKRWTSLSARLARRFPWPTEAIMSASGSTYTMDLEDTGHEPSSGVAGHVHPLEEAGEPAASNAEAASATEPSQAVGRKRKREATAAAAVDTRSYQPFHDDHATSALLSYLGISVAAAHAAADADDHAQTITLLLSQRNPNGTI